MRVDDPTRSLNANRLLSEELEEALGTDHVELPADRPADADRVLPSERRGLRATLGSKRLVIAVTFVALIVVGAILSVTTGSWWAVVVACAIDAGGTLIVATVTLHMTTASSTSIPSRPPRFRSRGSAIPTGC